MMIRSQLAELRLIFTTGAVALEALANNQYG